MGSIKGSLLVEAVLVLGLLLFPLSCFGIEIFRAAGFHAVLQALSFHYVRAVGMGKAPSVAQREAWALFGAALPPTLQRRVKRLADFELSRTSRGLQGRVRYRYHTLLPLWQKRIQITKSCPFYFSR